MNKSQKNRHNKYVMALEKLLANAEYLYPKENTKPDKKPNIAMYHYFKTDVKIGDKIYQVIFDTEEYKNEISSSSANILKSVKNLDEDTNSITDNKENLNPKTVHLYNISEKKKITTFEQSAYHGTPHRFDEFSTEYIGTGEGAQAHGWGLYFAGNKTTAQGYYDRLNEIDYYYDGERQIGGNLLTLKEILKNGKENLINKLRKQLEDNKTFYNNNKSLLDVANENIARIEKIDINKIEKRGRTGQLFEVNIPEDDVLLDENKTITGQSQKVVSSLKELCHQEGFNYKALIFGMSEDTPQTGKQIYKNLKTFIKWNNEWEVQINKGISDIEKISEIEAAKQASLLLNKYGIKGIKYNGARDGECYVIFDDKAVKILDKFYQDEERAKIEFKEQETIITLAKGNDASSFMHELAHLYLHDLQELAKVNKRAQKDLQEVYDILGFDSSKDYSEDEFREMHEKFARSFEAYLLNGQAPTEKMKGIFERFKEFLQQIYESLVDLDVEFSNEVKQCFDRLLTTDEEYEKEVLPMYEKNDELANSINQQNTLSYQIKNNLNAVKDSWKSFYDTVIVPLDTRLERISPELKKILRKHTFDMTMQSKKDCDKITPFLLKIQEIKKNKVIVKINEKEFNAYNLLSYALNRLGIPVQHQYL